MASPKSFHLGKTLIILGPLLLAPLHLITFVYGNNATAGLKSEGIVTIFLLLVLCTLTIYGIFLLISRRPYNASLSGALSFILFFSFDFLKILTGGNETGALALWGCLQTYLVLLLFHDKTASIKKTALCTCATLSILILFNMPSGLPGASTDSRFPKKTKNTHMEQRPIYHFILDGLGQEDTLKALYGLSIDDEIKRLEKIGFYIAQSSSSNYCQTVLSLASTLNMNYIQEIIGSNENYDDVLTKMHNNVVFNRLHELGYAIVTFDTGHAPTTFSGAMKFTKNSTPKNALTKTEQLYLVVLYQKSLLAALISPPATEFSAAHRFRVLKTLEAVELMPNENTYFFVHIISPHPPFVFNAAGESLSDEYGTQYYEDGSHYTHHDDAKVAHYRRLYSMQTSFIMDRTFDAIEQIIAHSPITPIIIIQADHGPGSELDWNSAEGTNLPERMNIFNAYLFPGTDKAQALYPSITPVNSYRALFNAYFGGNYQLLEDKYYYSRWKEHMAFIPIDRSKLATPMERIK